MNTSTDSDKLYVFHAETRVGVFRRDSQGQVSFSYEENYAGTPISLSLPITGPATSQAAMNYLDGLLPDDPAVREFWQKERSLKDASPFTLLTEYGHDVSGALSFSASRDFPSQPVETPLRASEETIAERIATLSKQSTSWRSPDTKPRFSLGGAQGKFSLAKVGDSWWWPTYSLPSTHIFKPPSSRHRHIELFEVAALDLARKSGVPSGISRIEEFHGQRSFVTERWDRWRGRRLFAEDLNQALGNDTDSKYQVSAPEIARLLSERMPGEEWAFVRQLGFNVSIGNADAHAKNYSVVLAGSKLTLAPLYDALPTFFYPQYNARFAMPIGAAHLPGELNEKNWRMFAREAQLDEGKVCEEAFAVMKSVVDKAEAVFEEAGADQHRMSMLRKHLKKLKRNLPTDGSSVAGSPVGPQVKRPPQVKSPPSPSVLPPKAIDKHAGEIFVRSYVTKAGRRVAGYTRSRPNQEKR